MSVACFKPLRCRRARCRTATDFRIRLPCRCRQMAVWWEAASCGLRLPFPVSLRGQGVPGILRAFDATNLGLELWDSKQNAARDDVLGTYAKFIPPTIANGKMYARNFAGQLLVYGLNPPPASGIRFVQVASSTQTVVPRRACRPPTLCPDCRRSERRGRQLE